ASQWFEFSLIAAGIVSVGAAGLIVHAIGKLGGYTFLTLPSALTSLGAIPAHIGRAGEGILTLYGAGFSGLPSGLAAAFAVGHLAGGAPAPRGVHRAGVALALCGVCRAFRQFFSATDLIVPLMATGIAANLAGYIFSSVPSG